MTNLEKLTTEAVNPASEKIDSLAPLEIVRVFLAEDAKIVEAIAKEEHKIAQAITLVKQAFCAGGRLIYAGAGTSGRLGVLDASECPPTFNSDPAMVVGLIAGGDSALRNAIEGAEDHPEYGVEDLKKIDFNKNDVLIGIATSGRTPYVIGGLQYAQEIGAAAIGFTCNEVAEIDNVSDFVIRPIVGPEIISGSTRMKAGTATKLVLNMITTGAMIQIGKTYGNLMVDLRASNIKLTERTERLVQRLTGLSIDATEKLLKESNGELKVAVVAQKRNVTPERARAMLKEASGQLRIALGE